MIVNSQMKEALWVVWAVGGNKQYNSITTMFQNSYQNGTYF